MPVDTEAPTGQVQGCLALLQRSSYPFTKLGSVVGTPSWQAVLQLSCQHPGEPRASAWGQEDAGTLGLAPHISSRRHA